MADSYDLAVIGGGSGGLACAQRAAEHGARVVLMEPGRLGGTCVNVGCVPKKIMWNTASAAGVLHDAPEYGFSIKEVSHDWNALKKKRDAYIVRLNESFERNMSAHNVELVRGTRNSRTTISKQAGAPSRRRISSSPPAVDRCCQRSPAVSWESPPTDSSSSNRVRSASRSSAAATSQ